MRKSKRPDTAARSVERGRGNRLLQLFERRILDGLQKCPQINFPPGLMDIIAPRSQKDNSRDLTWMLRWAWRGRDQRTQVHYL